MIDETQIELLRDTLETEQDDLRDILKSLSAVLIDFSNKYEQLHVRRSSYSSCSKKQDRQLLLNYAKKITEVLDNHFESSLDCDNLDDLCASLITTEECLEKMLSEKALEEESLVEYDF